MRSLLVAMLALVLVPAVVEAGGGTKPNSTVRVTNESDATIGVAVNPSQALIAALNSSAGITSEAQFRRLGGRIVGPGASTSIPARAGANTTVAAAFLGGTAVTADTITSATVSTTKGKTTSVIVSGDSTVDTSPIVELATP